MLVCAHICVATGDATDAQACLGFGQARPEELQALLAGSLDKLPTLRCDDKELRALVSIALCLPAPWASCQPSGENAAGAVLKADWH